MNRKTYIDKLIKTTGYDREKCIIINDILESHFIVGKHNKEKIINDFKKQLEIDDKSADILYNKSVNILGTELKNKIRHPFKSKK